MFGYDAKPTGKMKIVSKADRIQPTCVGVNKRGELVWEGRAMSYWQMAMFPLLYVGDFLAHWMARAFSECTGHEASIDSMNFRDWAHDKYDKAHRADRKERRNTGD